MRKASLILLLAAVAAAGLSAAASADRPRPPAQVFNSAAEPGTLQAKLDRALAEASKIGPGGRSGSAMPSTGSRESGLTSGPFRTVTAIGARPSPTFWPGGPPRPRPTPRRRT